MATAQSLEDEEAKKRVKEATWEWTQRVIVLLVTFGAGFFASWLMFGAGAEGAPALRTRTTDLEAQLLERKNKQVDIEGKVTVLQGRLDECQKSLNRIGSGAQPQG